MPCVFFLCRTGVSPASDEEGLAIFGGAAEARWEVSEA